MLLYGKFYKILHLNMEGITMLTPAQKDFLLNSIRAINDYPQPGIVFRDITTLINNKEAFNFTIQHLKERYESYNLDFIAGIESRGFILGAALAYALNIGFVPIRKKGKLPYKSCGKKSGKLRVKRGELTGQIFPPSCFHTFHRQYPST